MRRFRRVRIKSVHNRTSHQNSSIETGQQRHTLLSSETYLIPLMCRPAVRPSISPFSPQRPNMDRASRSFRSFQKRKAGEFEWKLLILTLDCFAWIGTSATEGALIKTSLFRDVRNLKWTIADRGCVARTGEREERAPFMIRPYQRESGDQEA